MNEPAPPRVDLRSLTYPVLQAQMAVWGEPVFRTKQVWQWLYVHLATDLSQMTNLPVALRERLARMYRLDTLAAIDEQRSGDGFTHKVLFRLHDGACVESVLMAYDQRWTACVSSQVGCAIGCAFCATGQSGFVRDLETGEIVEQALYFARQLRASFPAAEKRMTNIVLMGMGEPLLNYEACWQAIEVWNDHSGFDLGARRITISTAGVVPGILRLAEERTQVGLAVSLHAANDELRDTLVPLNRRYPLRDLMAACAKYVAQTGRRITIEYALIEGVNDGFVQAKQLVRLLRGLHCHVNLIPLNPTPGTAYQPSSRQRVRAFQKALSERGVAVTVRLRRGVDIQAGCGQLRERQALR